MALFFEWALLTRDERWNDGSQQLAEIGWWRLPAVDDGCAHRCPGLCLALPANPSDGRHAWHPIQGFFPSFCQCITIGYSVDRDRKAQAETLRSSDVWPWLFRHVGTLQDCARVEIGYHMLNWNGRDDDMDVALRGVCGIRVATDVRGRRGDSYAIDRVRVL